MDQEAEAKNKMESKKKETNAKPKKPKTKENEVELKKKENDANEKPKTKENEKPKTNNQKAKSEPKEIDKSKNKGKEEPPIIRREEPEDTNKQTDKKQDEDKKDTRKAEPLKTSSGEGDEETDDGTPAPIENGGKTDKYRWTQTLKELNVYIELPKDIRSKQLDVIIESGHLRVGIKGQPPILDGDWPHAVNSNRCMWTLDPKSTSKTLCLEIEKLLQMEWWECVLKGEPKINAKKIVPEDSKLSDLDADTQTTVEKMMYDQRQKQLGLPTSEEQKKREVLAKFMAAHPEMDFSQARIS